MISMPPGSSLAMTGLTSSPVSTKSPMTMPSRQGDLPERFANRNPLVAGRLGAGCFPAANQPIARPGGVGHAEPIARVAGAEPAAMLARRAGRPNARLPG